jgi:hypothetical protein
LNGFTSGFHSKIRLQTQEQLEPYAMKIKILSFPLTVFLCVLFLGESALARELIVTDCEGHTRAVGTIEKGQEKMVEATFSKSVASLSASLRNNNSGKTFKAEVSDGIANFSDIGAGTWALCFSQDLGTLRKVEIKDEGSNTAAIGLGVLGGAGAILATGLSGSSSSSATTTQTAALASAETTTLALVENPTTTVSEAEVDLLHPCARATDEDDPTAQPCFIDRKPTPLSPFE